MNLSFSRRVSAAMLALAVVGHAAAQDNILIYGNSIIATQTELYLSALLVQTGAPAPQIVTEIMGDTGTDDYVANDHRITASLMPGESWKAMVVEGATY